MKKITLIFFLNIICNHVSSQTSSKFDLEIKAGSMFIGSGDLWIYSNSLKANYSVNKRLCLFLEPAFAIGKNIAKNIIIQGQLLPRNSYHTSSKLNMGFDFKQLKFNKFSLAICPQLSLAKMIFVTQSTAYYLPFEQIKQEEFKIAYLPPMIRNEYTIGGGLGINPSFALSSSKSIGVGLTTQLYKNGSIDHNFYASFKIGL